MLTTTLLLLAAIVGLLLGILNAARAMVDRLDTVIELLTENAAGREAERRDSPVGSRSPSGG